MKDRIKALRKGQNMTQAEFANKLSLSQNFIAQVESGKKNPSDRTILDISREFGVNEDWLRTGEGDPYIKRTRNQEIAAFMNDVMDLPDEAFKKEFIDRIRRLDEKDWEAIANIVDKLLKGG